MLSLGVVKKRICMKQSTKTVKTYGSEISNEEKLHQRD